MREEATVPASATRRVRWIGVASAALVVLILLAALNWYSIVTATIQCDGDVPEWMIPADYGGGGCVELRPSWEARLPWNSGKTNLVCIGLCFGSTPYPARDKSTTP